jgi:hypothetical protein
MTELKVNELINAHHVLAALYGGHVADDGFLTMSVAVCCLFDVACRAGCTWQPRLALARYLLLP